MSKASDYVKQTAPLEFKCADGSKVASVDWYVPGSGQPEVRVPILDLNNKRKGLITAEDALRFGEWLVEVFKES